MMAYQSFSRYAWTLLTPLLFLTMGCVKDDTPQIEWVGINECWVSPLWGTNTPRFVRQSDGTVWVLGFEGKYPESETVIYRRDIKQGWSEANRIKGCYQPSVILLDEDENLHLLTNSQYAPVRHIRGKWDGDSLRLETIAEAKWVDDGRGWYLGAGIQNDQLYLAYISLDYDFWLSWKGLGDDTWAEPVLLYDGFVDSAGNYSMLYPRFHFSPDSAYIMASHTSDGSTFNFKDGVFLYSFGLNNPGQVTEEAVWAGRKGYDAYGFDMLINKDQNLVVAYASGHLHYGDVDSSIGQSGLYVGLGAINQAPRIWERSLITTERGFLSLSQDESGGLFAFLTNSTYKSGEFEVYQSKDGGHSWQINQGQSNPNLNDSIAVWAGMQELMLGASPVSRGDEFPIYFANLLPDTSAEGLKRYRLGYIEWQAQDE